MQRVLNTNGELNTLYPPVFTSRCGEECNVLYYQAYYKITTSVVLCFLWLFNIYKLKQRINVYTHTHTWISKNTTYGCIQHLMCKRICMRNLTQATVSKLLKNFFWIREHHKTKDEEKMMHNSKEAIPEREKCRDLKYTKKKKIAPITKKQANPICNLRKCKYKPFLLQEESNEFMILSSSIKYIIIWSIYQKMKTFTKPYKLLGKKKKANRLTES